MGNLFASLRSATGALQVYERAMATIQSNVTNSSTPGYAKQVQTVEANPFDLSAGLVGGVSAGPVISSRNEYAELSVRRQQEYHGAFDQQAADLAQIQPVFDIAGGAGIPAALDSFFNSWSALAVKPNDAGARQAVLDSAAAATRSFGETATALISAGNTIDREIPSTVEQLNGLASQLRDLNAGRMQSFRASDDAAADARMHNILEQVAEIADVTALKQDNGSYMLLLGGQTPIVVGDKAYPISADLSGSPAILRNAQGDDITAQVTRGRLSSMLDVRNNTIPTLAAGLDTLAQNFADQVNTILSNGVDLNGAAPVTPLFQYDLAAGAALTLSVPGITGDELAAAGPAAPGGNANALILAGMATAKQANGKTFGDQFAELAAKIGRDLNTAKSNADIHGQLLLQARELRSQLSDVSLNEEAGHLIEFQRSYQAAAKLIGVLNNLTDMLMNLI